MKKQINEPDFIGGQGPLTKEEEVALSKYFAKKKNKETKSSNITPVKTKTRQKASARQWHEPLTWVLRHVGLRICYRHL